MSPIKRIEPLGWWIWAVLSIAAPAAAQDVEIDPVLGDEAATEAVVAEAPAPPEPERVDPYEARLESLERLFESGVEAWRLGEYAVAEGRWLALLEELDEQPLDVRGRERIVDRYALLHDLGNAAFRLGRPLEAVGWYLAALRHAPRDRDTRANLDLARRDAGLEAEQDPDFLGSLFDSLGLLTPAESRWLALLGLLPVLTCLLGEAGRGGRAWRGLLLLSILGGLLASAPLARHLLLAESDPVLVVAASSVSLRAEPLVGRPAIGELDPGQRVDRLDELPNWAKVETEDGAVGWVSLDSVFSLVR
ncbi:MAG: SH3 domain-containing protein [Planctomycetota bacterium]